MATVTELIRANLLRFWPKPVPDLFVLKQTERSPEFERLRLNRMVMGALRYGLLGVSGKPQYDRVECMIRRLKTYKQDRNAEHLVDVANLAMLEFVEGKHAGVIARDDSPHTAAIT